MQTERLNVLAVNPGTRYLGIAVFRGLELHDWQVHGVTGSSVPGKVRAVRTLLSDIIERYDIGTLALKKLHPSRTSRKLDHLVDEIRALAEERKVVVRELTIDDLKRLTDPGSITNKRQMMEATASRYPFLYPELEREKKNKNPYLVRMFEAVGLGVAALDETDSLQRKVVQTK